MSKNSRGASVKLTKTQRRQLLLNLKTRALDGDMQAAHALSTFELAEVTRTLLFRDMDGVQPALTF